MTPAVRTRPAVIDACDACLRRTGLLAAVAPHLEIEWRRRRRRARVLALSDDALIALDPTGAAGARHAAFDAGRARDGIGSARLSALCRCSARYPERLRRLEDPPAVIHVSGRVSSLHEPDSVAVVGSRRATPYGLEVARSLGRGLAAIGVPIVSGLALGVDSAAHAGSLEGEAPPVAVLAGGADVPYPARMRALYARVVGRGAAVSELPPGFVARRWCFVARNRIIAALAEVTVVVEAAERSGSLTTADFAAELGRTVGAVPGQVTSPLSAGAHALLDSGAVLVRDRADVVAHLSDGAAARSRATPKAPRGAPLSGRERAVLEAIESGLDPLADPAAGSSPRETLSALTRLEVSGLIRRSFGGRYVRVA